MKKSKKAENIDPIFNQKEINHIVHYTNNFEFLLKILRDGFSPSYCAEKINDIDYYIPMTSFCNIPLGDVDLYMRYGKFGIGMSLEWAIKNSISPVVYIHETTPFKDIHSKLLQMHFSRMLLKMFDNKTFENAEKDFKDFDYTEYDKNLESIRDIAIPAIQFFKNWKTNYKGKVIRTYHEREWRYIPNLINDRLLPKNEFIKLKETKYQKKPHLPEFTLPLNSLENIRYIIINNEMQRKKVLSVLEKKFGKDIVHDSIISGNLMVINDDLIRNDF